MATGSTDVITQHQARLLGPIVTAKNSDIAQVEAFRKKYGLFKNFLFRVWKWRRLPTPTRVQYDMADYLQFGPDRGGMEAFRGVGKSWVTAAFCVWKLGLDPQERILVVSASKDRADGFSIFVKQIIENLPEVRFLKPRMGQRDSNLAFDVGPALPDQSPSVKSVGITGQITGSRATLIIADDIETPKNSMTVQQQEKLSELVMEFDAIIKPDERENNDPNGAIVKAYQIMYLGTPHTEQSLYIKLSKRGYHFRIWTLVVPADFNKYVLTLEGGERIQQLAPLVMATGPAGTPVDPERFGPAEVKKQRAKGKSYFALQYMLDTSLSDAERYPFKLKNLIVMGLDPDRAPASMAYAEDPRTVLKDLQSVGFQGDYYHGPAFVDERWVEYQQSVLAIDPAGRGLDEIGLVALKQLHGKLFMPEATGLRGGYTDENLTAIANMAKRNKVNAIVMEKNFGDGMFGALLKPYLTRIYPVSIEEVTASGQKELRIIETLEGIIETHRLVVCRSVIENDLKVESASYSLFHQMTRLTKERGALTHDDRLDALEMGAAYFQDQMAVDERKAKDASEVEAFEEELQKLMEGIGIMNGIQRPSWTGGA